MSEKYDTDLKLDSPDHLEYGDTSSTNNGPQVARLSETLKAMPMAPTPETLGKAVELAEADKTLKVLTAFKLEWRAVLFCCIYILPAIGQGFDSGAGSISVNMPAFLIKFGSFNETTHSLYAPSLWLALWNASASMGNAIGSFICGAMTDRFGYRNSQLMGCSFSVATVFLQVFAINREMILVGKLLNGIAMGLFVAISAGYISEVAGPKTRATVMSCLAASPLIGIIAAVGTGSNPKVIGNLSDWGSWKLIFALQWVLPALAIPLLFLTPESPTALVKLNKPEAALKSLKRFRPTETEEQTMVRLAGAQLAVSASIEESQSQSTSYLECFKGTDLKRTLIVMMLFSGTQFSGTAFLSNGLYFLAQTGLAFSTVSDISLGFLGLSAVVCVAASFLIEKAGRRELLIYGGFGHACLLTLIGGLHYATSHAGLIATAMIFNIAISTAQITSNAPVYALSVEVSSVRLRSKTQSIGFMTYYIMGWIFLFTVPYMFQVAPEGAGWGVRTCWLFAGLTFGFVIFCYFFVGETKGRSYADIDELYHRGVSPRKFKETEVHAERTAVA